MYTAKRKFTNAVTFLHTLDSYNTERVKFYEIKKLDVLTLILLMWRIE
jgi:hypothetical protein